MADVETLLDAEPPARLNVADRLATIARCNPDVLALAAPRGWWAEYHSMPVRKGLELSVPVFEESATPRSVGVYETISFAQLNADATRIASGLADWGVPKGTRLALLVRPGIDFVALVFGLLRAGMVIILVDPGLGRKNLVRCLSEADPQGFVAISEAQVARLCLRHKFPNARWNVTVGWRLFWGGLTFDQLLARGDLTPMHPADYFLPAATHADDPAAIIFTSGSTGPPKGVLYTHRMFATQVREIQSQYGIDGGIDLACFPLFALFNAAMGVSTVFPKMNFSRPAAANPKKLLEAANDWQVTQAFASPAVWRVLSEYCAKTGDRIKSLQQVFSCGAPVPADVLRATLACVGQGAKMHTPYGMTESLPVATIEAAEVLGETAARTDQGAGVCVGRKFDSIEWRVIRITDEPIASMDGVEELRMGEIGELIVRGPQVSSRYVTRTEANTIAKIGLERAGASSPPTVVSIGGEDAPARCKTWHRTGDVGYFDEQGRFWYCGRKSQRVVTAKCTLFTECVEAVVNRDPGVRRSALVGIGPRGQQVPVIVAKRSGNRVNRGNLSLLESVQSQEPTRHIEAILFRHTLPVDIRHNAKINREDLAVWAARRLPELR